MEQAVESRRGAQEGGLPRLAPGFDGRHAPGRLAVRPERAYRPPLDLGARLGLERQETTRPAPIGVPEAERRRRADFPLQASNRYPTKLLEAALKGELARRHGLSEGSFVVGNGIMSLLATVFSAYTLPGDEVVVPTPGFWPAYSYALQRGVAVVMPLYELVEPAAGEGSRRGLRFPEGDVRRALRSPRVRLCYLCSPDNPTGASLPEGLVRELVAGFPDVLFVVDCAYWAYERFERSATGSLRGALAAHEVTGLVREGAPNLLGAFTFSKHYALANHRVGYLVGSDVLVRTVASWSSPYGMSEIDLAVAYYNLLSDAYAEENARAVARNKRRFEALLAEHGVPHLGGSHNALSVRGPEWHARYAAEGIATRPLEYFEGIPNPLAGFVRLAIPSDHDGTELLLATTRRLLAGS